jgi:hypothetical protein
MLQSIVRAVAFLYCCVIWFFFLEF